MTSDQGQKVLVIGCGFVGAPLAAKISGAANVSRLTAYDTNAQRVVDLKSGVDTNNQLSAAELQTCAKFWTSSAPLHDPFDVVIITVPTPITADYKPDTGPLFAALATAASVIDQSDTVVDIIIESSVSPGMSRYAAGRAFENCRNKNWRLSHSPERINPGDQPRPTVKLVGAQDEETLNRVAAFYESFWLGLIHRCASIEIAEAAKMIENAQRDVNIAFCNEVAVALEDVGLPVSDVFKACATKWNWHDFKPGIVGGHCIGVDVYWLIAALQMSSESLLQTSARVNRQLPMELIKRRGLLAVGGSCYKPGVPDGRNSPKSQWDQVAKLMRVTNLDDPFGCAP